ncbi:glycosyltransferase family 39 protein [Mesorhizobium ventifaucium]|uniref:glycosyltransferase family 39 protein n=1 Tax=Mesorhizobium ventifaucium TaxID=666020 RepID=UPI0020A7DCAA|nr:glycosyltransferase family 39 protein [Mesorhizobium ventifaucium]
MIGVVFLITAISIFVISTRHGIGILPDSTRYMRLDETPFDAPLYAWLLDIVRAADGSVVTWARVLGLVFVCVNILLIWLMLSSTTTSAAALGTALIVTSPQFIFLHAVAMSEPLFIGLVLTTVLLFCRYFESRKGYFLVFTGVTLGLAMLARFTAAPLALAIAACLLLDRPRLLARRFLDIALIAITSGVIFLTWAIGSRLAGGNGLGRELRLNGNPDAESWLSGLNTLTNLLVPMALPFPIRLLLLIAAVAVSGTVMWICSRRILKESAAGRVLTLDRLPLVLGLFAIFYCLFMIIAVHVEANLPLFGPRSRYAVPLYIAVVMATTVALGGPYRVRLPRLVLWAFSVLIAVVLAAHLVRSTDRVWRAYATGIGYDATAWHSSPLVQFVKDLPADAIVYSNGADALGYLTGRFVRLVPRQFDRRTQREDPNNTLEEQILSLRRSIISGNGYVVFFDAITSRFYNLPENDLVKVVPLSLYKQLPDGRVYVLDQTRIESAER